MFPSCPSIRTLCDVPLFIIAMPPKSAKSTPTKPKPKAAQHSRAVVKNKGARAAVNMYLLAYNALSAAGWAYVLARLISHMAAGGAGGASGKQGFENMLVARGSTGFAEYVFVVYQELCCARVDEEAHAEADWFRTW